MVITVSDYFDKETVQKIITCERIRLREIDWCRVNSITVLRKNEEDRIVIAEMDVHTIEDITFLRELTGCPVIVSADVIEIYNGYRE